MLIAHLSDAHIKADCARAYDVVDTCEALRRAVAFLETLHPAPDAVVVTGDVADDGAQGSYEAAAEILRLRTAPLFVVPGNHDHKGRLCATFPDVNDSRVLVDGRVCFSSRLGNVRMIGLDTAIPGNHGGGVTMPMLDWLRASLEEHNGSPVMLFMHHPPCATGIGAMDIEPFQRHDELAEVIRGRNVLRLCTGHIHRAMVGSFAGVTAVGAPSTGMQLVIDPDPGAPARFIMEPEGAALHQCLEGRGGDVEIVSHFGVIPHPERSCSGPHPFFDVVSPLE